MLIAGPVTSVVPAPPETVTGAAGAVERAAKNGEIAVKWQNFYTGIADKVARP